MLKNLTSKLKDRTSASRSQLFLMGVASFLESTIVPIPLETILIPYYHSHRESLWRTATVVTIACLFGASIFYWIGGLAMESWGLRLVETFADKESFDSLKDMLNQRGFLLILAAGVSPIPFQIAMLGAGAVEYSFIQFLIAASLARGIRYFGLAALVHRYGERALEMWHDNKLKASAIALLILAVIYALGKAIEAVFLA
tara:strand:+ start:65 stop:664 length:600 start_codon:yes stop_codon:yes gene_type:complete